MPDGQLPPVARGLFDAEEPEPKQIDEATRKARERHFNAVRERGAQGDFTALLDAHLTGDANLYRESLGAIVKKHFNDVEKLAALASYIVSHHELRADKAFVEALHEAWTRAPEQIPITNMLRIAALSDDAQVYEKTVEVVLEGWKQGRLPEFTAENLCRLFESEYWMLGADAKRSGAGFILKETLADVRRQFCSATRTRRASHSTEAG